MKVLQWILVLISGICSVSAQRYIVDIPYEKQVISEYDPSGRMFTNTFTLTETNAIADLNVILKMTGNSVCWNGDYYITLLHNDSNKRAVLMNRVGCPLANWGLGYGDNGVNVIFDDQATNGDIHVYGETLELMGATLTGVWSPDGRTSNPNMVKFEDPRDLLLNQFNGINPSGTWTLFIADFGQGGSSALKQWGLEITAAPSSIALEISKPPQDQFVLGGSNTVFEVTAKGDPPLSYQWRFNGTNLLSATNSTLQIENVAIENAGPYDVIVSSGAQSLTNPPVNLTILYQLTTNIVGGGLIKVLPDTNIFPAFAEVALTAVASDGFIFDGWSGGVTNALPSITFKIDSHTEIMALFKKAYTVAANTLGQGTVQVIPWQAQYVENTSVEISAIPSAGFIFHHWQGNFAGITNPVTLLIDSTKSITAVFMPAFDPISDKRATEGELFSFSISTNQSPALQFDLMGETPAGVVFDSTNRLFSWNPTEKQAPATNTFIVIARDSQNPSLSVTQAFVVYVDELNTKPQLIIPTIPTLTLGQNLELAITATDSDVPENSLTFELVQSPTNASLDPLSGLLSWRPQLSDAGTNWSFTVRVTDNGIPPLSEEHTFSVEVKPVKPIVLMVERMQTGYFAVKVDGDPSMVYSLQFSTNLIHWENIPALKPDIMEIMLIDTNAISTRRFYRVTSP